MAFGSVDVAVRFLADASSVQDQAGKFDGIGRKLKGAALGIGAAIGAAFAVDQVTDFIGAAEEAEVASKGLAKVLSNAGDATGEWAKHAEDLASTLQETTGIDDELIKGAQAVLGTFHEVGGTVGQASGAFDRATKAALDMSKVSSGAFGDANSAAKMLGKALEDPVKGLAALGKAGVTFNDEQKKVIKHLVETGDKAGAMAAILDVVEGQVGGVAEASVTASDKMSVAWGEIQEAVGAILLPLFEKLQPVLSNLAAWIQTTLIPALGDFARSVTDFLSPAINTAVAWIRDEFLPAAAEFAGALKDLIAPAVQTAVEWITDKFLPKLGDIATWFSDHRKEIGEYFTPFVDAIRNTVIPFGVGLIKVFLGITKALVEKLWPPLKELGEWAATHREAFGLLAVTIGLVLVPAFYAWAAAATAAAIATAAAGIAAAVAFLPFLVIVGLVVGAIYLVGQLLGGFGDSWEEFKNILSTIWEWLYANWPLLLKILVGPFAFAIAWIMEHWSTVLGFFQELPGRIAGFLSTLGGIIAQPFQWAWGEIVRIKDDIIGVGTAIVDGFKGAWNGFARGFNRLAIPSFSIGGWSTPFGDLPSWDSPRVEFPDLPTLAAGGIVTRPTLALLGERGPEAVIPLTGGHRGMNVTININAGGLGADAPAIQSAVVAALRQYTARNGPLPATIVGA